MSVKPAPLEQARRAYRPRIPEVLRAAPASVAIEESGSTASVADAEEIRKRFPRTFGRPVLRLTEGRSSIERKPLNLGVVLSGGQAPGGHNVLTGLHDGLQSLHEDSKLFGFLGGPRGIFTGQGVELDAATLEPFRNSGGFDLIGSGRDKIETAEQLAASRATCEKLGLAGLVIVGGDDSNTNAAVLAEYLVGQGSEIAVLGVPKTIDGDLKGGRVEASFGFDTATKVYSELIGNICRDAKSSAKYWHFVKLMGRSASHVTLECALQTHANIALIGEEVREKKLTLDQVVTGVAETVRRRAEAGKSYGVCLVPEGLIEFIPEMRALIDELNGIIAREPGGSAKAVEAKLSPDASRVFGSLPAGIRDQLLLERDSHGNVQVSLIDTEKLLVGQVSDRIDRWRSAGEFPGKLRVQRHFFGYEGRCAAPSDFDADYTYTLGRAAAVLAAHGRTGYICCVRNLAGPTDGWQVEGVPLASMMRMEPRRGKPTPVIGKALVRTDREPFSTFAASRERWELEDDYRYPGAIQYFGPPEVASAVNETLRLEHGGAESDR